MREGRFTASQINRLLGKEGLKRTRDSIDAYAFEKAVETLYGREEQDFVSKDMQRGIDLEPLAFNIFKEIKELDFLKVRECGFYKFMEYGGGSPDGIVSDGSVLEIKCPRRAKFYKLVANGASEIDAGYVAQMQMQMLCADSERAYFFNYHLDGMLQYWNEIIVQRDDKMIQLIEDRMVIAQEIKLEYINKINKNQQW